MIVDSYSASRSASNAIHPVLVVDQVRLLFELLAASSPHKYVTK